MTATVSVITSKSLPIAEIGVAQLRGMDRMSMTFSDLIDRNTLSPRAVPTAAGNPASGVSALFPALLHDHHPGFSGQARALTAARAGLKGWSKSQQLATAPNLTLSVSGLARVLSRHGAVSK